MTTPPSQAMTGASHTSNASQHVSNNSRSSEKKDSSRKSLSSNIRTREDALKAFKVPSKFKVQEVLGQGAYGIVVSALDTEIKEIVAMKKIERVFDHETFTKRTLREIKILKSLKHENIVGLKSIFASAKAKNSFDDLYLVFELMETDLASIIKSPQPLTGHHVQFFIYQILRGLKFLHSAGIIHRDIKPRNLLVNSNCDLKICDMGLARFDTGNLKGLPPMTDYVATRWYRAPEIILQWEGYSKAIDLWSVGCILAELIGRKPIFPGNEADHQITLICDVLGRPSPALLQRCPHPETIEFLEALPKKATHPLAHVYRQADIVAIDLLTKLLRFDPDKRLSVAECLKHPYLAQLHCPQDEPESKPLDLFRDFPYDSKSNVSNEELLQYVLDEIDSSGKMYIDIVGEEKLELKAHSEPRPPTDSPPPLSPVVDPPMFSPKSHEKKHNGQLVNGSSGSGCTSGSHSVGKFSKDHKTGIANANGLTKASLPLESTIRSASKAKKPSTPQRTFVLSKNANDDVLSPALVVHSPIFDSSQDSTLPPHTPKTPSTPSNVSMELGRLGAAIDELRAM